MPTWLDGIQDELESLNPAEYRQPEDTVLTGKDNVVGTIGDSKIRNLWSLARQREKRAGEIIVQARFANMGEEERMALLVSAVTLQAEATLLSNIFWHSVRIEFGLEGKPSIGVRGGVERRLVGRFGRGGTCSSGHHWPHRRYPAKIEASGQTRVKARQF